MTNRHLELFSGTHSIGKVCENYGIEVVSLDRDLPNYDKWDKESEYRSTNHINEDIMKWDYKTFPNDHFTSISMSPVCLWSSQLRKCWLNSYYNPTTNKFSRKEKEGYVKFTQEVLQQDIDRYMKPMVDKCFEILEYFMSGNPNLKWWLENPKSSTMKDYITEKYEQYDNNTITDYCKYGFPYRKSTRFWNNFNFEGKVCCKDCDSIIKEGNKTKHKEDLFTTTFLKIDGKTIRIDSSEKRKKYKEELKNKPKVKQTKISKLYRYRIPQPLITDMLKNIYNLE